jgi:hypothetical protein
MDPLTYMLLDLYSSNQCRIKLALEISQWDKSKFNSIDEVKDICVSFENLNEVKKILDSD